MSSNFRLAAASLAATCFLTSMAGCSAANRMQQQTAPNGTLNRQGTNLSQRITKGTNPGLLMQGTGYNTGNTGYTTGSAAGGLGLKTTAFDNQRAQRIVSGLGNVGGVKNARAIVNGNIALISYTPSGASGNMTATKDAITKKVKSLDGSVKNVVVSESSDIAGRMQRLSNDITGNKPADDLNNTFNQLVKMVKGPY